MINSVVLIGNLTREPEKVNGVEKSLVKLCIAVNDSVLKSDGTRDVDYFNITVWNGLADNCFKYLHKGSKIAVSGKLKTRNWEKENGEKGFTMEVVARDIEFLSSKSGEESKEKAVKGIEPVEDNNLPF